MAVKPKSNFDYEKDEKRGRPRRNAAWAMSNSGNRRSKAAGGGLHTRIEAAYRGKLVGKMIASDTGQFNRETTQLSIRNQIERGKKMRARSEEIFPKDYRATAENIAKQKLNAMQSTAEQQRKAYERDGRLGRAKGNEMTKTKPKYQAAPPPKPPRKGGDNIDKGYQSSNPAKNRQYPGSVGQVGKALEKAYEGGRARGARMAGAKTTSTKGRIPVVRQVRKSTISPVTGARVARYGGSGGGLRIGLRRGFGER